MNHLMVATTFGRTSLWAERLVYHTTPPPTTVTAKIGACPRMNYFMHSALCPSCNGFPFLYLPFVVCRRKNEQAKRWRVGLEVVWGKERP